MIKAVFAVTFILVQHKSMTRDGQTLENKEKMEISKLLYTR